MVMVDMPAVLSRLSCAANSAATTLARQSRVELLKGNPVFVFESLSPITQLQCITVACAVITLFITTFIAIVPLILSNATLALTLLPVRRALHVVKLAAGLNLAATVTPFVHYLLDLAGSGRVTAFGGAGASSTGSGV